MQSDASPLAVNPARRRSPSLDRALSIADLRALARKRLPNFVFEYIEGGSDDETTLRRNREVFAAYPFNPRMGVDITSRDLTRPLFGRPIAMPLVIAPTGGGGLYWPRGDRALAEAAAEAGIPMTQSTVSMMRIEAVASVPGLRHWFQLYPYGDESVARGLIEQALAAGSETLVVTMDSAVSGNREWDRRNYRAPNVLSLRSKLDILRHPDWLLRNVVLNGMPNFETIKPFVDTPARPDMFDIGRWLGNHLPRTTWDDIARIRSLWPRTLLSSYA